MKKIELSSKQSDQLRVNLHENRDVNAYRRAAALLAVSQGRSITQIAQVLGVTRQSIYNWIASYGRPKHVISLADAPRSGRPTVWTQELQAQLQTALRQPPPSTGRQAPRWSVPLLRNHLTHATGCQLSVETLRRRLREMGFHSGNINAFERSISRQLARRGWRPARRKAPPCQKTFVAEYVIAREAGYFALLKSTLH